MSDIPQILYHYASIEAFKGIVDNEYLRMTRHDQLNDPSEMSLPIKKGIELVEKHECADEYEDFKKVIVKKLHKHSQRKFYITSFSQKGNDLSQWRAYAGNGGVSIGFDYRELNDGFFHQHFPEGEFDSEKDIVKSENAYYSVRNLHSIYRCRYDGSGETEKIFNNVIAHWFIPQNGFYANWLMTNTDGKKQISPAELYINIMNNKTPESRMKYLSYCLDADIFNLLIPTKHNAYKAEKEWRWINPDPNEDRFSKYLDERNREYVCGAFHRKDCIKEIWISPHGDKETIRRVLEFYKEKYDLTFKIHESKIPYRL